MSFYKDLSDYQNFRESSQFALLSKGKTVLNVGWLENGKSFDKGAVPDSVLPILFELCKKRINVARGWHKCSLCANAPYPMLVEKGSDVLTLGSAEVWIEGKEGVIYASPNMIYHYIKDHQYQPPQVFIDAVLRHI